MRIFGFDGLDARHKELLPKTIETLKSKNCQDVSVHEPFNGMWERGWTKIYSGWSADESEAYYNRLSGEGFRSASVGEDSWKKNRDSVWNTTGFGLYGLPGTYPIPEGDFKFFVAGAGAGIKPSLLIPDQAINGASAKECIREKNPIWEVRLDLFKDQTIENYLETCYQYLKVNIECFDQISKKCDLKKGFFVSRWPDCVLGPLYSQCLNGSKVWHNIKAHFNRVDTFLANYFNAVDGEILICADHGMSPRQGSINLNSLINQKLNKSYKKQNHRKVNLKNIKKSLIPYVGPYLKYLHYKGTSQKITKITKNEYCLRYIPGIFCDNLKEVEINSKALEYFNALSDAFQAIGYSAESVKLIFLEKNVLSNTRLPNFAFDVPEGFFFENKLGSDLLELSSPPKIKNYDKIGLLSDTSGGVKSSSPLVITNISYVSNLTDLTLVNRMFN